MHTLDRVTEQVFTAKIKKAETTCKRNRRLFDVAVFNDPHNLMSYPGLPNFVKHRESYWVVTVTLWGEN